MHRVRSLLVAAALLSSVQLVAAEQAETVASCRIKPPAGSKNEILVLLNSSPTGLQSQVDSKISNPNVITEEEAIPDGFYDLALDKELDIRTLSPVKVTFARLVQSNVVVTTAARESVNLGPGIAPIPFDLKLVRRLRTFQLESSPSKFGRSMLIEAMDRAGSLLGRGVFLIFYSPCLP